MEEEEEECEGALYPKQGVGQKPHQIKKQKQCEDQEEIEEEKKEICETIEHQQKKHSVDEENKVYKPDCTDRDGDDQVHTQGLKRVEKAQDIDGFGENQKHGLKNDKESDLVDGDEEHH